MADVAVDEDSSSNDVDWDPANHFAGQDSGVDDYSDDTDSHYTDIESDLSYASDVDLDEAYQECVDKTRDESFESEDDEEDTAAMEYIRRHTKPCTTDATSSNDIHDLTVGVFDTTSKSPRWRHVNSMILIRDFHGIVKWFSKNDVPLDQIKQTKLIFSPLYRAASCGNLPIFNFLLGEGFPIDSVMNSLVDAASNYSCDMMKCLIDRGADVNQTDVCGSTALHAIAREPSFRPEKIKYLLSKGAQVDDTNMEGMTPLHYAVLMGSRGSVLELIRAGASVNVLSGKGRPLLHMAVDRGVKMMSYLYKAGARPGICTAFNEAEAAVKNHSMDALRFLVKRNCVLRQNPDFEGLTIDSVSHCRCYAHQSTSIDLITLFLSAGGKVHPSVVSLFMTVEDCEFCFQPGKYERWMDLFNSARSLQQLCCLSVRRQLLSSRQFIPAVEQLCVPDILKDSILFKDVIESILSS